MTNIQRRKPVFRREHHEQPALHPLSCLFSGRDGGAGNGLRLHIATDEGRQRFMAERFVEIVGDVLGEATLLQVLLGVAGETPVRWRDLIDPMP